MHAVETAGHTLRSTVSAIHKYGTFVVQVTGAVENGDRSSITGVADHLAEVLGCARRSSLNCLMV